MPLQQEREPPLSATMQWTPGCHGNAAAPSGQWQQYGRPPGISGPHWVAAMVMWRPLWLAALRQRPLAVNRWCRTPFSWQEHCRKDAKTHLVGSNNAKTRLIGRNYTKTCLVGRNDARAVWSARTIHRPVNGFLRCSRGAIASAPIRTMGLDASCSRQRALSPGAFPILTITVYSVC